MISNRTRSITGETVNWLRIKHIRFQKSQPEIVQCKYSLSAEEFMEFNARSGIRGRKAKARSGDHLKRAYKARLPIASAKKKDLMKLVNSRVIPPDYSSWYLSLPENPAVHDNLPEPSADEPLETD